MFSVFLSSYGNTRASEKRLGKKLRLVFPQHFVLPNFYSCYIEFINSAQFKQNCNHPIFVSFKDVRAHCYCASLVHKLFIRQARATSFSSACTESKTRQNIYRADDICVNLVCEYFCWMLGDPHFFFGRSLPFFFLSIILKNEKNLHVGRFNFFLIYYSNRVELVHGYR